jgi:hypothetical protein
VLYGIINVAISSDELERKDGNRQHEGRHDVGIVTIFLKCHRAKQLLIVWHNTLN